MGSSKRVLITGITGQDGAYLAKMLLEKGYEVYGAFRRTSDMNMSRLKQLGIENDVKSVDFELLEFTNLRRTLERVKPDEIYNLAAQSFVALSFEQPVFTADVTGLGVVRVLEAIRDVNKGIRFYQASSSEMFGKVQGSPQNESTPFYPRSPYAVAKLMGHWMTVNYRESYDMYACSGILFNHESPLRGLEFVTRKITRAIAMIKHGRQDNVRLGNLDSKRDWGYAAEYVEAMWLMLQQDKPDDYVIATGKTHSVREFVEFAFREAGIEIAWSGSGMQERGADRATGKVVVEIAPEFFRPAEVDLLIGDCSKAKNRLGWEPRMSLAELVGMMVRHDMQEVGALKAR